MLATAGFWDVIRFELDGILLRWGAFGFEVRFQISPRSHDGVACLELCPVTIDYRGLNNYLLFWGFLIIIIV